MDASLLPVSLPARGSVVARTVARVAPLLVVAGIAAAFAARSMGMGAMAAHGFAEAIPLNVAPSAAGRITELLVSVGQPVKAGDPIMRLDPKPLTLQHQQAEAERSLLTAKLLAETSKVEDEVMRAEVWRLRTVAGSQQDRAALAALDKEVTRLDGLLADQLVKASDVEPRKRERDALAARVGIFDKAQKSGQAGLDARQARAQTGREAVVQLRVAPLRQALEVNQATLAQIDLQIAALTLVAPADGVVGTINRRPGELLQAGEAAVTIVAHRPGIFEIYVSARETRIPDLGATAQVSRVGLFSRTVPGRVIEVAPTVAEMPPRLRSSPNVPVWGRRIIVDASAYESMRAIPAGEEIRVRL
jgi:membrane fusion protein (multidrug efflux system)